MGTRTLVGRRRAVFAALFAALATSLSSLQGAAGAGSADSPSDGPEPILTAPAVAVAPEDEADTWVSPDQLLADVGRDVPSFGGFHFDADGTTLVVWLTGDGTTEIARNALSSVAAAFDDPALAEAPIRVRRAQFAWADLHEWHMRLFAELDVEHVLTDVDETINRLVVGVEDPLVHGTAVLARATVLGVPATAIRIVHAHLGTPDSSLQGTHRPIVGGLQTQWFRKSDSTARNCTIGVPATRSGVVGFITASHCSNVQGSAKADGKGDGTAYGQHLHGNLVGSELRDGIWWTSTVSGYTCPAGWGCRFADVNFVSGIPGVSYARGRIAWPPSAGSVQWDGTTTRSIVRVQNPVADTTVSLVGRTSGLRNGVVKGTCVNASANYSLAGGLNGRYVCQAYASYTRQGGDSGGPIVWRQSGQPTTDRNFVGIHSRPVDVAGVRYGLFSPALNLRHSNELGSGLRVCISTKDC